jgi:Mg-chelatase subunit ChlD
VPGQELSDTVRDIQERTGTKLPDDLDDDIATALGTHLSQWRGVPCLPPVAVQPDTILVAAAKASVPNPGAAKATIGRLLRAPEAIATEHRLTSGRIDRRALARIPSGARDVFSRRVETDATNVGVVLIVDNSHSMHDTDARLPMARALALHFGEACQQAGAESAILTFEAKAIFANTIQGVALRMLKTWSERMGAAVATRLASMDTYGSTPLSHGIMHAAGMLAAKRDLSRRIVLALTDGECILGPTGVRWASSYAAARGVEVIGIALENEAELGFPATVRVANANDLTALALRALAKALAR